MGETYGEYFQELRESGSDVQEREAEDSYKEDQRSNEERFIED